MVTKEDIIDLLSYESMNKTGISKALDCSVDELNPLLDELAMNDEIIKNSRGIYRYNKLPRPTKEGILNLIKNKKLYEGFTIENAFSNKKELFAILDEMQRDGQIYYSKKYRTYSYLIEVTILSKSETFAFCHCEGEEKDYYIPEQEISGIYPGDTVLVYPIDPWGKLITVAVHSILKHAVTQMVGRFIVKEGRKKKTHETYESYYINSEMRSFPVQAYVAKNDTKGASNGQIVFADIEYTPSGIRAYVREIVGHKDDPGIEIAEIAMEYGFRAEFPVEVLDEIKNIPDEVIESQYAGRRDFRNNTVITIDGDSSKDFDDAVYVEKLKNGNYKLEVYIADVAEYVKEGSPLDAEALKRGTSVYLADRVIPMIPHKLSNGICSLNEGVDRLVLACLMEIDLKGNLVNYEITEGVIRSLHRMTYNNVNKMINNDSEMLAKYNDISDMINSMKELSEIIRRRRYKRGGIEFDTKEYEFTLDENGKPIKITERERFDAEKMIEDFMLSANEAVAYHMNIMHLPSMYRVHEQPDQEKLHAVFQNLATMTSVKQVKNDIHPKQIQELLESIKDNPNYYIMNNMILRSMMKAKYSAECLGHYGLAMQYYCHFTSPIRRYPDLITHRMIKKLFLHPSKSFEADINKYNSLLPEIALRNSLSERKAIDCERAVDDMLFAWYMIKRIGNRYEGIITSVTNFGMFVSLDNGVEGLVSYRNMNGFYEYDERTSSASNGRTTYRLGDKVSIIVVDANKKKRTIDFMMASDYKARRDFDEYEGYLYK